MLHAPIDLLRKYSNMKKLTLLCLLLTLTVAAFTQTVSRPRAGGAGSWRLLGTVSAKHSADHDIIIVKGPYDYFRKIKFKVTDAPLNMQRVEVFYDDGGAPEKLEVRYNIPKGGESRVIDLRGGRRKLKSVHFWYDTKGFLNGKADVTLFGMK
ncbi:MAG: hypothetical protein RL172_263 [Bacteroidota bacterium]|jgi:hypothetical protein